MATFHLTTQGIEAGYDDDGFFAFGVSVVHEFDNQDWQTGTPRLRGLPVQWRIGQADEDLFERYVEYSYPPEKLSPRVPVLREYFAGAGERAKVKLHRWDDNEPVSLQCSFPKDPSLAAFIMGVVAADREFTFRSPGWTFLTDDQKLAPAPTVTGFMERHEPAFSLYLPTLRLK